MAKKKTGARAARAAASKKKSSKAGKKKSRPAAKGKSTKKKRKIAMAQKAKPKAQITAEASEPTANAIGIDDPFSPESTAPQHESAPYEPMAEQESDDFIDDSFDHDDEGYF